jgi:hypothetical protein
MKSATPRTLTAPAAQVPMARLAAAGKHPAHHATRPSGVKIDIGRQVKGGNGDSRDWEFEKF